MRATLSVLGLFNYDNDIFENMVVPDDVDSSLATMAIVTDCAEMELLYPDPEYMKFMIGIWSERELPVWTRIFNAISEEYNPLENYNRKETWSDTDIGSASGTGSSTTTNKVVGYNDAAFTNHDQTENYSSGNNNSRLESRHSGNVSGNIGVTTSQQMLNQELDVAARTDIYEYIVRSFKNRFCLMVY